MSLSDDLKKTGSFIFKKGKELGTLTKLKIEINDLNNKISDQKKQIGELVIKNKLLTDNDEITTCIKEIDDLNEQIKNKEKQIKDIETEES